MRNQYIVSYDIGDPKRLRKVFKLMQGYGEHVQLSVFRCDLSPRELVMLEEALSRTINHSHDQVLVVDVGPVDGRAKNSYRVLGKRLPPSYRRAVIV